MCKFKRINHLHRKSIEKNRNLSNQNTVIYALTDMTVAVPVPAKAQRWVFVLGHLTGAVPHFVTI